MLLKTLTAGLFGLTILGFLLPSCTLLESDPKIDGTMTHTVEYPEGLPESGFFVFESHNEFRVKEFGVRF